MKALPAADVVIGSRYVPGGAVLYPVSSADGAFDSPIEALQLAVNLSGLSIGRHFIFVESQDASGNWGPPTATFVRIQPFGYIVLLPVVQKD